MARNSLYTVSSLTDARETGILVFDFGSEGTLELDWNSLPDEMKIMGMVHGFKQKGQDATAGIKEADLAKEKVENVFKALRIGQWTTRVAGEKGEVALVRLAKAVAIASVKDPDMPDMSEDQAKAQLEGMDRKQRAAVRNVPEVAIALAEMKKGGSLKEALATPPAEK